MSMPGRVAVVFHSGYGHTAKQAQAVARGAAGVPRATVDLIAWGDGMRWKNKIAGGFTNSQNVNGSKENTLLELFVLAAHGLHWVALGEYGGWNTTTGSPQDLNRLGSFIGAMAQSDGDASPDLAPPASDLAAAEALGRRVAEVARDYNAGRRAAGIDAAVA